MCCFLFFVAVLFAFFFLGGGEARGGEVEGGGVEGKAGKGKVARLPFFFLFFNMQTNHVKNVGPQAFKSAWLW